MIMTTNCVAALPCAQSSQTISAERSEAAMSLISDLTLRMVRMTLALDEAAEAIDLGDRARALQALDRAQHLMG